MHIMKNHNDGVARSISKQLTVTPKQGGLKMVLKEPKWDVSKEGRKTSQ